ncbi:MAG: DUF5110 domain-containing protein, partial [Ignavibacteria bacterium]
LFGDAFLVAPVLWPGSRTRDVRLPEGDWYDYWTGEQHSGPKVLRVDAPMDRIPLFVRAGAIVPTQQDMQFSDQAPVDPLTIDVFSSASSASRLYEDDGVSLDYQHGEYCLRALSQKSDTTLNELVLSTPEGGYRPPKRRLIVRFQGMKRVPSSVSINGTQMPSMQPGESRRGPRVGTGPGSGLSGGESRGAGWIYNAEKRVVTIQCGDTFGEQRISVR